MPLLQKELFVETALAGKLYAPYWMPLGNAGVRKEDGRVAVADRESALKLLDYLGQSLIDGNQMGKAMRPWDVNPKVFDHLDKNKSWWGFEFETGWQSAVARSKAVKHVWDSYDGVMFDSEGEGRYPVEITFIPAEEDKYLDGTCDATTFMQWVNDNRELIYTAGGNDVGCHWNVSGPEYRGDPQKCRQLARFLNRTLENTMGVNGQRKKMFGRESLYGGFYPQHSNVSNWLEMKGFRTAYSRAEWDDYVATCHAMQKFINYFFANYNDVVNKNLAGINLYDVAFNGAEVALGKRHAVPAAADAKQLFTRFGGDAQCEY